MAKQVQRAIGWVAAFLLAVGMLFLPVSKAYAGPVSGGSPESGEMRGVWVSYLDWNDGRRMRLDIRKRWIRHWTSVYRRG